MEIKKCTTGIDALFGCLETAALRTLWVSTVKSKAGEVTGETAVLCLASATEGGLGFDLIARVNMFKMRKYDALVAIIDHIKVVCSDATLRKQLTLPALALGGFAENDRGNLSRALYEDGAEIALHDALNTYWRDLQQEHGVCDAIAAYADDCIALLAAREAERVAREALASKVKITSREIGSALLARAGIHQYEVLAAFADDIAPSEFTAMLASALPAVPAKAWRIAGSHAAAVYDVVD